MIIRQMDRREFIRQSALCLLGVMAGEWDMLCGEASQEVLEPMIYKRLFQFTEYKERKATDFIVIHNTGNPGVDKDTTAANIHKYHQEGRGWAGKKARANSSILW